MAAADPRNCTITSRDRHSANYYFTHQGNKIIDLSLPPLVLYGGDGDGGLVGVGVEDQSGGVTDHVVLAIGVGSLLDLHRKGRLLGRFCSSGDRRGARVEEVGWEEVVLQTGHGGNW